MRSRILGFFIVGLALVGAIAPAAAQRPPVTRMSIRQVTDELVRDYSAYTEEGPNGYLGVPPTICRGIEDLFLVATARRYHHRVTADDPGVDIAPTVVSVIVLRSDFSALRTDYRLADGRSRTYPVRFGYYHPGGQAKVWVSGWHARHAPPWGRTPSGVLQKVRSAARHALRLRRANLGDLWRSQRDDAILAPAGYPSDEALTAWAQAYPDYMVHPGPRIVRVNAGNVRQKALALLRRSGERASVIILGFPRLFR